MSTKWTRIESNNELDKKLYETFTNNLRFGYAEFGNEKTVMTEHFANIVDKCANLEVKDSDVFVASFPKTGIIIICITCNCNPNNRIKMSINEYNSFYCLIVNIGTTWCQEMVWMIVNNLDLEGAKRNLTQRFPFLEFSGLYTYELAAKIDPNFKFKPNMIDSPKYVDDLEDSPRLIKTHLPWHLMPRKIRVKDKTPKIIYITRNAKDTCVSYYYHCILKEGYRGDFETFCNLFLAGRINYGNFWNHILGYWEQRSLPNLLLIKYEDMKQNLTSVIKKVSAFLDKSLTEEQVSALVEHLSFENMKINPAVNYAVVENRRFYDNNADGINFLRSGTVGSYKQDMGPEMETRFDRWIEEYTTKTGIKI